MEPKICPLLSVSDHGMVPCLGERCGWWDILAGACCLASDADYIRSAGDELEGLREKVAP